MSQPISISAIASISALGGTKDKVWQHYRDGIPLFQEVGGTIVSKVSSEIETELQNLQQQNDRYKNLDRSVLLAILAAKKCVAKTNFQPNNIGVNVGSSRGATGLFEKYHQDFQQHGKVSPFTSPHYHTGKYFLVGSAGFRSGWRYHRSFRNMLHSYARTT